MTQKVTYLTRVGLEKLRLELESLKSLRRQQVAERIQHAKEIGGTVDNAEYDEAKNEQAFVEGRILTLESMISSAVLIPDEQKLTGEVQLGSTVTVQLNGGGEEQYTIVGSAEADPLLGRISNESPVGKALIGRRVGEMVEVPTPRKTTTLVINSIQ